MEVRYLKKDKPESVMFPEIETDDLWRRVCSVITSDNHTLLYSSVPFMKKQKSVFSRPHMSCNATLEVTECCRIYDRPCAYDADHTTFDIA